MADETELKIGKTKDEAGWIYAGQIYGRALYVAPEDSPNTNWYGAFTNGSNPEDDHLPNTKELSMAFNALARTAAALQENTSYWTSTDFNSMRAYAGEVKHGSPEMRLATINSQYGSLPSRHVRRVKLPDQKA